MTQDQGLSQEEIEKLVETVVERKTESIILEKIVKEEEKRFRRLKYMTAIVGLVGLGTFGTVANYLIGEAVDKRIEITVGDIEESIEFSKFFMTTLKIDLSEVFSLEDVGAIMNYLRKVANKPTIRHSDEFLAALYQATASFAAAGKSASIDEIFTIYEQEILTTPNLVEALLHHYGQEIVGREQVPEDDLGYEIFKKLERVAADAKVPESALAYRVLYESKKPFNSSSTLVADYLERSVDLNDARRRIFFFVIIRLSRTENWVNTLTQEAGEIQRVVRDFLANYGEQIAVLYGLEDQETIDFIAFSATNGVSEQEAEALARLIANGAGTSIR